MRALTNACANCLAGWSLSVNCGTYFYHRAGLTFAHDEKSISFVPKG